MSDADGLREYQGQYDHQIYDKKNEIRELKEKRDRLVTACNGMRMLQENYFDRPGFNEYYFYDNILEVEGSSWTGDRYDEFASAMEQSFKEGYEQLGRDIEKDYYELCNLIKDYDRMIDKAYGDVDDLIKARNIFN